MSVIKEINNTSEKLSKKNNEAKKLKIDQIV